MRRIAHISDVHFGREDPAVVAGLLEDVAGAEPDIVVVSGDLTQRAKKKQFRAARKFLGDLPQVPQVVVPGNHDLSATNLLERTLRPLARYQRYITPDLSPFYKDDQTAIAGISTVRVFKRKEGRINAWQVRTACAQLETAASGAIRVIVTHHPMDLPAENLKSAVVRRAEMAMRSFAAARVDLFLSGHLHTGASMATSVRYKLPGYSAIVVHAGTAVSTRTRGVPNAWNLLRVEAGRIAVEQRLWLGRKFVTGKIEMYGRGESGWSLRKG